MDKAKAYAQKDTGTTWFERQASTSIRQDDEALQGALRELADSVAGPRCSSRELERALDEMGGFFGIRVARRPRRSAAGGLGEQPAEAPEDAPAAEPGSTAPPAAAFLFKIPGKPLSRQLIRWSLSYPRPQRRRHRRTPATAPPPDEQPPHRSEPPAGRPP